MSEPAVTIERHGARAVFTLSRPDVHNALNEALISELTAAFQNLSGDPAVRAVVLGGVGPSFCAGADLAWMGRMAGFSRDENVADSWTLQRMYAAIAHCPKPTIARVHGAAIGGGVGLVAVCDAAIASTDAAFALTEVRLGLAPAVIAPYVAEKIGVGAARALVVSARRIGADEALRIGLVQQVTPPDELDAAIDTWAASVEQAAPNAVASAKELLREIADKRPDDVAKLTVERIAELRVGAEGQEGIRAFLGKRKPQFP